MKRAILFIFSTVLITASCSKESEKSNNFSSRLKSSERLFTDAQIAEIGEKHWRLVALKQVAQKHSSDTIISFEEFVNKQYSSRSGLW